MARSTRGRTTPRCRLRTRHRLFAIAPAWPGWARFRRASAGRRGGARGAAVLRLPRYARWWPGGPVRRSRTTSRRAWSARSPGNADDRLRGAGPPELASDRPRRTAAARERPQAAARAARGVVGPARRGRGRRARRSCARGRAAAAATPRRSSPTWWRPSGSLRAAGRRAPQALTPPAISRPATACAATSSRRCAPTTETRGGAALGRLLPAATHLSASSTTSGRSRTAARSRAGAILPLRPAWWRCHGVVAMGGVFVVSDDVHLGVLLLLTHVVALTAVAMPAAPSATSTSGHTRRWSTETSVTATTR